MPHQSAANLIDQFQVALQRQDTPTALVLLRVLIFTVQQTLQSDIALLRDFVTTDTAHECVNLFEAWLEALPQRTNIDSPPTIHDEPAQILMFYRALWQHSQLSDVDVFSGVASSLRSPIAGLAGSLELIKRHEALSPEAELIRTEMLDVINTLMQVWDLADAYRKQLKPGGEDTMVQIRLMVGGCPPVNQRL